MLEEPRGSNAKDRFCAVFFPAGSTLAAVWYVLWTLSLADKQWPASTSAKYHRIKDFNEWLI